MIRLLLLLLLLLLVECYLEQILCVEVRSTPCSCEQIVLLQLLLMLMRVIVAMMKVVAQREA
jgi:hypothetical protein